MANHDVADEAGMRTILPDDSELVTRDGVVKSREDERVSIREGIRDLVVETDSVLLVSHARDLAQARKHARHFAEVMQQPGWLPAEDRE
jgi:hypothetical protein